MWSKIQDILRTYMYNIWNTEVLNTTSKYAICIYSCTGIFEDRDTNKPIAAENKIAKKQVLRLACGLR